MATLGLILATLGGAGILMARLLVLRRLRRLSWERELPIIVSVAAALVVLVIVATLDAPLARADPVLAGAVMATMLAALGAYALWLGNRYASVTQLVLGALSLAASAVALLATVLAALGR